MAICWPCLLRKYAEPACDQWPFGSNSPSAVPWFCLHSTFCSMAEQRMLWAQYCSSINGSRGGHLVKGVVPDQAENMPTLFKCPKRLRKRQRLRQCKT